ncbi:MAG TPA: arylamine N-acetyltransferase, partial [Roseiflexaceae bacterium]|nr:arylamine N-acetyltransferase [Roseiflexaceae bacterium]
MTEQQRLDNAGLAAYFKRIGYEGDGAPTLATLRAIHHAHATTIAFENLTPLMRQPVNLDLPALLDKLVASGRGGYCFEQNLLLRHVLTALGFRVTGLAARVRWNVPDGVVTARGHMLLRVDLADGPYLADVGFGGLTLTAPLRLAPDLVQQTPHEPFRLVEHGAGYALQGQVGGEWRPVYTFELQEQHQPDYEVSSWYLSNHPRSHFITSLIVARPDTGRRYALHNNQLSVHQLGGPSERRTLATVDELCATLERDFRITLPDRAALATALAGVLRS